MLNTKSKHLKSRNWQIKFKKHDPTTCTLQKAHITYEGTREGISKNMWKGSTMQKLNNKKGGMVILIPKLTSE